MNRKALRALFPSLALAVVLPLVWAAPAEAIPGHAPVASDDHFDAQLNEQLVVPAPGVLGNDYDIDGGTFTVGTASAASAGSLTMKTDGSFLYQPPMGFVGDASFTYRALDKTGLQSGIATVTITVTDPDLPPVSAPDAYSTTKDTTLIVSAASGMLANDADPEGHAIEVFDINGPSMGDLNLNGHWDGRFTYTPPLGFVGTETLAYRAVDLVSGKANGWTTVTFTVVEPNHAPVGVDDAYSTPTGVPLVVAASSGLLANDTDPEGATLSVFDLAQPAHGTVTHGAQWDGSFTYTPDAGYAGPDTFQYRATDGQANGLTDWIAVDVTVVPDVVVPVELVVGDLPASVGGKTVPVKVHVTSSNGSAAGVPVTLSLGGSAFTAATGSDGDAVVSVTLPATAGRYELTGHAGNVEVTRSVTVGTAVTGKIAAIRKLHHGQVLIVRGQVGTTAGHVVVTLTGPGGKRTFQRSTSATGKLSARLPAKATSRLGQYKVTVTYVADAQHFATASWTRAFRSVR